MYAVPRDDALFCFDKNARTPSLEFLQPVTAPIVTMEDRAPNVAAAAMITPHVQSLPAELACTKRVLSAVYVFAVRGRRRPRVELMAGVVATKASAQNCTKVDVAEAGGLFASLWW